jgi:molybdate transport system ATP-binding protein
MQRLSALDPALRRQLQDELKRLHVSFGTTTLLVSHDIPEILRLADRVVRIEDGKVVFDGIPAAAFGGADAVGSEHIVAQHVSGPDAGGLATVHIDGRLRRVRYRQHPGDISIRDTVLLRVDEVTVERLA